MEIKSSVSLQESYQRIEALQPKLNAAVTMIEPYENPNQGKLAGVPVVLKDNINTKGIRTTASSRLLDNYVPVYDATIVTKLKEAGAVFVCKASMDELGMGGTNKNAYTGAVHNPYDLDRISGGSSGGCAVLVASDAVSLAIGTDTGDSIRKPAAYTGVVGVKPTYGRISRYGIIPYASSLDHVGYFTTNIKDAALALEVLAGRDDKDMTSSFKQGQDYIKAINGNYKNYKIAIIKPILDSINNQEIKKCFLESVNNLKAHGVIIEEIDFDLDLLKAIYPIYNVISCAEATSNNANLDGIKFGPNYGGKTYSEVMFNARTKGFSALIKRRFVIGSYALMRENQEEVFLRAQRARHLIVNTFNKIFEEYDAVYCPAAPSIAPLINKSSEDINEDFMIADNWLAIGNFGGYPSITLPIGFENDMPLGANLMCKPFDEVNLFNISLKIEEGTGLKNLTYPSYASKKEGK